MTVRADDAMPSKPPAVARGSLEGHYAGFASRFLSFAVDMSSSRDLPARAGRHLVLGEDPDRQGPSLPPRRHLGDHRVCDLGVHLLRPFLGASGRTARMAVFGVQVVRDDGGDVSERRAALRTLALPLSFLLLA